MLSEPVALVAQPLHMPRQVDGPRNRAARRLTRPHANKIQNRNSQPVFHILLDESIEASDANPGGSVRRPSPCDKLVRGETDGFAQAFAVVSCWLGAGVWAAAGSGCGCSNASAQPARDNRESLRKSI